jgi:hypothetical protein
MDHRPHSADGLVHEGALADAPGSRDLDQSGTGLVQSRPYRSDLVGPAGQIHSENIDFLRNL